VTEKGAIPHDASLRARFLRSIEEAPASEWDRLAAPEGTGWNPFVSHAFLSALERSGSVSPATGWSPRHCLLEDASGALAGAAPAYLKAHSRGEFVFDFSWAEAFERAGGRYYPKLLCAVPFTPVTGPRLLSAPGHDPHRIRRALALALRDSAEAAGLSSAHVNFVEEDDADALAEAGYLSRLDQQFHWNNNGYSDFEDFLASLSSRKRKMIRKERAAAREGLTIRRLTGAAITEEAWDAFFAFYMDTGGRKWGSPYLNRSFFRELGDTLGSSVLLVIAEAEGRPVAGALNLIGGDALYGRYWGRLVDRPFLHFEICYYQAIEFAIERRLLRVEAGAQGEHKIARGYAPQLTRSAHWIAHDGLRAAVRRYLDAERPQVLSAMEALAGYTPFRKDGAPAEADEEGF